RRPPLGAAMSAPTRSAPPEAHASPPQRSVPLLIGAGLLVVLVVAAVIVVGVERPPAVRSLAEDPDPAPPAAVAWTVPRGEQQCLRVAHPDGAVSEPWCAAADGELIGWSDEGFLVRRWSPQDDLLVLDPRTGDVLSRDVGGARP